MKPKIFKNKTVALLILFFFTLTSIFIGHVNPAIAAEWSEITTANLPDNYSRAGIAQAPNGNYIFMVGGINKEGVRYSTIVSEYNVSTRAYTKLGDIQIGLEKPHVIYYNNSLYIIGGTFDDGTTYGGKNTAVYRFNLGSRTCTTLGNAPRTPYYSGMAVQGTNAYFYGGQAAEGMMKYDLTSDSWTELASGPRGLDQFWFSTGFATTDGKVHFYGGRHTPTSTYFNDVVTYDPASGNYTMNEIPAYGTRGFNARAIVIGSKVVIAGGTDTTPFSRVISFDYDTKTWNTETSLPIATGSPMLANYNDVALFLVDGVIYGSPFTTQETGNESWSYIETINKPINYARAGFAQDGSHFYLVGGEDRFGGGNLKDVYSYDTSTRTYTKLPDLPIGLDRSITAHVINSYLYVFGGMTDTGYKKLTYRLPLSGGSWEDMGSPETFYSSPGSVVQGDYVYFFGGGNSGETLLRYNVSSNTWTNLGANPRGLTSLTQSSGFATPDGKIHFYSGNISGNTFTNAVVTYDPALGTFSTDTIPAFGTLKRGVRNVLLGTKIYFPGGILSSGYTDEVVSFDVENGTWNNEPSLPFTGPVGVMSYGESLLAYRDGNLYQFTPGGIGGSILQATIIGQSAAFFSPSTINPTQVTLNGTDGVKASYNTSPWSITDARGTGDGWYITMSATVPASGNGKTINLSNLKLTVRNINKAPDALTSSSPDIFQYANDVSLETPATMISAPVHQGMGTFVFTPGLELSIPASSYAGQYNSTAAASFYENAPVI